VIKTLRQPTCCWTSQCRFQAGGRLLSLKSINCRRGSTGQPWGRYLSTRNSAGQVTLRVYCGTPALYNRAGFHHAGREGRLSGPHPQRRSYASFASFSDPDGNGWLLQEVTVRLPGRVDADTTFTSSTELASALRRAEAAHGEHEKRIGQRDADWPKWYAEYIVREQAGKELPS
jgi:hypothetical protein